LIDIERLRRAGNVAAALWVFGGAFYFFIHFTLVFYRANEPAILGVLERIRQLLTG
jgi:hypothetical protein